MSSQKKSSTRSASNGKSAQRQSGGIETRSKSFPVSKSFHVVPKPPRTSTAGRNTIIDGSELFATLDTQLEPEFSSNIYRFNPGLDLYQRLSKISLAYEKYTVKKLQIVYVPTRATTITPGSVYLAADFDPSEAPPSNISALSTYEVQASSRLFDKCVLDIPPTRMHDGVRAKKMRCGPVAGDLALYDACSIVVASFGCDDAVGMGQIWVHYEIVLISPQVEPSRPLPVTISYGACLNSTPLSSTIPVTLPYTFEEPTPSESLSPLINGLGLTPVPDQTGVWMVPCGTYLVRAQATTIAAVTAAGSSRLTLFADTVAVKESLTFLTLSGGGTSASNQTQIGFETTLVLTEPTPVYVQLVMTGTTLLSAEAWGSYLTIQVV